MGNRPKPSHLRVVEGNRGKRSINKAEPKPQRTIPSPPDHLADVAKVAWGRMTVILDRMGVLTEADVFALERMTDVYAEILHHRERLKAEGWTQVVETGAGSQMIRANPSAALLADADRRFKGYLIEFGLTPAARTRVNASGEADKGEDKAAQYF